MRCEEILGTSGAFIGVWQASERGGRRRAKMAGIKAVNGFDWSFKGEEDIGR
jgi:hypothetical protein